MRTSLSWSIDTLITLLYHDIKISERNQEDFMEKRELRKKPKLVEKKLPEIKTPDREKNTNQS